VSTTRSSEPGRHVRASAGARWSVALAIGVVVVALLVRGGLPLLPPWNLSARLDPSRIAPFVFAVVVAVLLRASRMRHLLRRHTTASDREVLAIEWTGHLAALVLPFRLGEFVRPGLYRLRAGVPLGTAASIAVLDRVVEGWMLSAGFVVAVVSTGLVTTELPHRVGGLAIPVHLVPTASFVALGVFSAACCVLVAFHVRGRAFALRAIALFEPRMPRVARGLLSLAESIAFYPGRRRFVLYVAELAGYWLASMMATVELAVILEVPGVGFAQAVVISGTVGVGLALPAAPGYVGSYQAAYYAGLATFLSASDVVGRGGVLVAVSYFAMWITTCAAAALGVIIDPGIGSALRLLRADRSESTTRP